MEQKYYTVSFDIARTGGLVVRIRHSPTKCGPNFEQDWHHKERTALFGRDYKVIKVGELEKGILTLLEAMENGTWKDHR